MSWTGLWFVYLSVRPSSGDQYRNLGAWMAIIHQDAQILDLNTKLTHILLASRTDAGIFHEHRHQEQHN